MNMAKKKKQPDPIVFVKCPECGYKQADMGGDVACEECGYGPIPTESDSWQ